MARKERSEAEQVIQEAWWAKMPPEIIDVMIKKLREHGDLSEKQAIRLSRINKQAAMFR